MSHASTVLLVLFAAALLYVVVGVLLAWRKVRRATREYERYAAAYLSQNRADDSSPSEWEEAAS